MGGFDVAHDVEDEGIKRETPDGTPELEHAGGFGVAVEPVDPRPPRPVLSMLVLLFGFREQPEVLVYPYSSRYIQV